MLFTAEPLSNPKALRIHNFACFRSYFLGLQVHPDVIMQSHVPAATAISFSCCSDFPPSWTVSSYYEEAYSVFVWNNVMCSHSSLILFMWERHIINIINPSSSCLLSGHSEGESNRLIQAVLTRPRREAWLCAVRPCGVHRGGAHSLDGIFPLHPLPPHPIISAVAVCPLGTILPALGVSFY